MPRILVIDDQAICREPIELALRAHGFDTASAGSGREAFFEMHHGRPDAVLLDVTMPEMDGLSVLRAMRRNPQFSDIPVVLLTECGESDTVLEAARHRISAYILKSSFTVDALMTVLAKCIPNEASVAPIGQTAPGRLSSPVLSPGALPSQSSAKIRKRPTGDYLAPGLDRLDDLQPIITRRELRDIVSRGLELRPLSATVQQVMALTTNANCTVDDISHAVSQDQALSLRLLKTANSTAFARGRPVDTIKLAVQRLGIHEIRNFVTTLAVLDEFTGSISEHLDARLFWEHSISCGVIARELARRVGYANPENCFLWGVLHDVGRLILIDHVPELYSRVWNVASERSIPLVFAERNMLTLDHSDILARALEHWRFSNDFIVPVVNHHRTVPQLRRLGSDYLNGAAIITAANMIAHALLLGDSGDRTAYAANEVLAILGLTDLQLDELRGDVVDQIADIKLVLLRRGASADWPDFADQIRQSCPAPIRPLFIGSDSAADTLQTLFQRLSDAAAGDAPNVAVLTHGRCTPFKAQLGRLGSLEEAAGVAGLPILAVALDRSSADVVAAGRSVAACQAPLNIGLCIRALKGLLSDDHVV